MLLESKLFMMINIQILRQFVIGVDKYYNDLLVENQIVNKLICFHVSNHFYR